MTQKREGYCAPMFATQDITEKIVKLEGDRMTIWLQNHLDPRLPQMNTELLRLRKEGYQKFMKTDGGRSNPKSVLRMFGLDR